MKRIFVALFFVFILAAFAPVMQAQDTPPPDAPVIVVESASNMEWGLMILAGFLGGGAIATGGFIAYQKDVQPTLRKMGDDLQKSIPQDVLSPLVEMVKATQDRSERMLMTTARMTQWTEIDDRAIESFNRFTQTFIDDATGTYSLNDNPELKGEAIELVPGQFAPPPYTLSLDSEPTGFVPIVHAPKGYKLTFKEAVQRIGFAQSISPVKPGTYRAAIELIANEPISLAAIVILHTPSGTQATEPQLLSDGEMVCEWIMEIETAGDVLCEWVIDAQEGASGAVVIQAVRFEKGD